MMGYHGNPANGDGGQSGGRSRRGKDDVGEEGEDDQIYCGVGPCRPSCLQGCADIKFVTLALCLAGLATSTLSIYINSQLTTLERQFGFSSSVAGALLSCNDVGYLLTTLFMSHLARRVHILRILSLSTLLFGLSGLLCTVPFFASLPDLPPLHSPPLKGDAQGSYLNVSASAGSGGGASLVVTSGAGLSRGLNTSGKAFSGYLCSVPSSGLPGGMGAGNASLFPWQQRCDSEEKQRSSAGVTLSEDKKWMAVVFIGVGMVFQGFGKSPRQPFIGTYIDDNVPKTKSTLYLGIVTSCSIFGPVLAFTLGGLFSKMYLTLEDTTMTPMDPRWVGAWWLGFLVFGLLGILASIPTFFFPRRLRPQPQLRQLELERKRSRAKGNKCCSDAKEFFRSLLRVLRSPVLVCMLSGSSCVIFGVAGQVAFMPKYLEAQFLIPAWKANMILGFLNVTSAAGGTLMGGIVTSRLKLSPLTCLKVVIVCSFLTASLIVFGFFLGCNQPEISMGASAGSTWKGEKGAMTCSSSCQCDDTRFFPVCGIDDVTYFSPCHAGCMHSLDMGFSNCSCVNSTMTSHTVTSRGETEVRPGFCAPDCRMLYPYAVMKFLVGFCATIVIMPGFVVNIRSVSEQDKPLALGLSSFFSSLFGWLLGPLLYGRIVDSCCLLWSTGCQGSGSCSLYDLQSFRYSYHAALLGSRLAGCLFFCAAWVFVVTGKAKFAPHQDHTNVIQDTLPAEAEKLMLEDRGKSTVGNGDDDFRFTGGKQIYKGKNVVG